MKKVCVLLASYNGASWIEDQIVSILKQEDIKLDLFVSDDCSTDKTLKIIKKLSQKNKNIFFWKNRKRSSSATQNFFKN